MQEEEGSRQIPRIVISEVFENQIAFVQNLTFSYLGSKFEEKLLSLTDENMESLHIRIGAEYT